MSDPTRTYYLENAQEFYEGTVNLDMKYHYKSFLKVIPKGGKILDAGCGSGRDSIYFKREGYIVVAFDYSEALVKLASNLIGSPVLHMSFKDVVFIEEFDGIWACASLCHVPKNEMQGVIAKLAKALKPDGILYASFKYGDKEEFRKGRLFSDYTESTFQELIEKISSLKIVKHWKTADVRPDRKDEYWLNVLIRKEF
jgi:SAM-dependent methyltransferase